VVAGEATGKKAEGRISFFGRFEQCAPFFLFFLFSLLTFAESASDFVMCAWREGSVTFEVRARSAAGVWGPWKGIGGEVGRYGRPQCEESVGKTTADSGERKLVGAIIEGAQGRPYERRPSQEKRRRREKETEMDASRSQEKRRACPATCSNIVLTLS